MKGSFPKHKFGIGIADSFLFGLALCALGKNAYHINTENLEKRSHRATCSVGNVVQRISPATLPLTISGKILVISWLEAFWNRWQQFS